MDETSITFIEQAINFLQLAIDKHGKVSRNKVETIKNIIEELEDILYGKEW